MTATNPAGGAAIPVSIDTTRRVQGGAAIPVYGYNGVPTDGRPAQAGPAIPVRVLTAADLKVNGGTWTLEGRPLAMPVYTAPSGTRVAGGPAMAVYPINVWPPVSLSYFQRVLATQTANLIAYWPLWNASGTTSTDISGNGHNGTYNSVTLGQAGIGDGRTSAYFDGTNSYIQNGTAGLLAAANAARAQGTLLAWIKLDSTWNDGSVRSIFEHTTDTSNKCVMFKHSNGTFYFRRLAAGGSGGACNVTMTPSDTGWICVAQTWSESANQFKAFKNGAQVGSTLTNLGTWTGNVGYALLGAGSAAPIQQWKGWLAHCALWSVALTPTEIALLATV